MKAWKNVLPVLALLIFLVVASVQPVLAAPGDVVVISELSAWGYQDGGVDTTWGIKDGHAGVKFDVISLRHPDHFTPEGYVEKMHHPDGGGYDGYGYRIFVIPRLRVVQGDKFYAQIGGYLVPMVTEESVRNYSLPPTQERSILFDVEVKKQYNAATFLISGEYFGQMRNVHCRYDEGSCEWSQWQEVFRRSISEQRSWFVNANAVPRSWRGPRWWLLEKEVGSIVPIPAPAPKD